MIWGASGEPIHVEISMRPEMLFFSLSKTRVLSLHHLTVFEQDKHYVLARLKFSMSFLLFSLWSCHV